jgi:hypothetical protein
MNETTTKTAAAALAKRALALGVDVRNEVASGRRGVVPRPTRRS